MKLRNLLAISIVSLSLAASAFADAAKPAGVLIASCTVTQAQNPDDVGTVVQVFQSSDAGKSLTVSLGGMDVPADNYTFSSDRGSLQIQAAKVIDILISKSDSSASKMVVSGEDSEQMTCTTNC